MSEIGRRAFIAGLGAAAWPVATWAHQDDRVRALQLRILSLKAEAAADKIAAFIADIESQLSWTTQLPWSASTLEQRRFDGLRLLRQSAAITELSQLDSSGKEQLRVSRLAMDVVGSQTDFSKDPRLSKRSPRRFITVRSIIVPPSPIDAKPTASMLWNVLRSVASASVSP